MKLTPTIRYRLWRIRFFFKRNKYEFARRDPWTPARREAIRKLLEEEREGTNNPSYRCPYCGEITLPRHIVTHHKDLWIGGTRVDGTVWHGWADH